MLTKLLSLLAQAKGATIAAIVVAGAATATVGATSPQVQDAISNITSTITGASPAPHGGSSTDCASENAEDSGGGQPAVVAQRNAAEKLLRDAYNDDHKKLEDMRGGAQGQDNKVVGDIIRTYDDQLRDKLNVALNQVAALTLGREGQVRKAEASASAAARPSGSASATPRASESPRPSASERAEASESPKPSCSPKPSGSAKASGSAAAHASASESPRASGSAKPSDQGRVAVAERTTLDADIQKIVDDTVKAMADLVQQAADAIKNASPAPDHGKPSDSPGNANTNGSGGGKPSDQPGGKPSASPKK